jgi:pimeloyl-ACP methyl ester carboxylesterase
MPAEQKLHVAFDSVGQGEPAVVLIHGLFEDRTYYASQASHLGQRRRVLNVDLRGHGESDVPEEGYSVDALADDVARVCDEAGISRAIFCGHSVAVALRVATRRPDLAAGVVLLDGAVLIRPEPLQEVLGTIVPTLETEGWRDALLGFFPGIAGTAAGRVRADISAAPRVYALPLMREIMTACTTGDDAAELAALRCPLMYVHSEMPLDLERLRELQPDAIVEEIPGVGHYTMLTAPDQLNALLDRFLEVIA